MHALLIALLILVGAGAMFLLGYKFGGDAKAKMIGEGQKLKQAAADELRKAGL